MSIFARLQFDSTFQGQNVIPYSNNVTNQMNSMPQLLSQWQINDISNSNVGGYVQNPVINVVNNLVNEANTILNIPSVANTNVTAILVSCNTLISSAGLFISHTNRMSGVTGIDPNNPTLPTYQTAIATGKIVSYIVNQSDGVQNNAPMLGSFTSLYSGNNLNSYYSTIQNYANTIQNSINITANGLGSWIYTSNLSPTTVNTMASEIASIATFMDTRRNADLNFYYNSQSVVSDYNNVRQYSNMGQTETTITNNLTGTPKLLSRINS